MKTFACDFVVDGRQIHVEGFWDRKDDLSWHACRSVLVDGVSYLFWAIPDRGVPPEECAKFEAEIHAGVARYLAAE